MDTPADLESFQDDADDTLYMPPPRKSKRRLVQLLNLRPSVWFRTAGVIGPPDSPTYVIEVEVDGQTFQGISQSKKKAKVMAAEYALVYLGEIDSVTESPPPPVSIPQSSSADDFSSDFVFPTEVKSALVCDFSQPDSDDQQEQERREVETVTSADKPAVNRCDNDLPEELRDEDNLLSQLIGKNPLTIIGEMQIDAGYRLLAKSDDPLNPMFAVEAVVEGETFRAGGNSKKLAKARAARAALRKLYNLEFGISENGMPIYEGDDRIWQHYKARLEREAAVQLQPQNNPMMLIMECFPDVQIVEGPVLDGSAFHSASLSVFDDTYSGVGMTKLDAKVNAAANAVDALQRNGVITARLKELKAERREADWLKRHAEKPPEIPQYDHRMFVAQKNAAGKLNVIYHNIEFMELAETRIPRADLTAFVVAVIVEGRTYVGVGKTKKEARCEAAEKALQYLRLWTDVDEDNKRMMLYGVDEEDPVEVVMRLRAEAGLPPYSEEWDVPDDYCMRRPPYSEEWVIADNRSRNSSWDHGRPSHSRGDVHSHTFNSRGGPPPSRFRGPVFRPPTFPLRGRFDDGHHVPRPTGPTNPVAIGRGFTGERPSRAGFSRDGPNREGFNGSGPSRGGFGRGYGSTSVSRPPRARGNTPVTRGFPRGQVHPRGGLDHMGTAAERKIPPAPGYDRINQVQLPPVPDRVGQTSQAIYQPSSKPVVLKSKGGMTPVRPNNSSFTSQLQSSDNIFPVRHAAPPTNPATDFNFGAVSTPTPNPLHTSMPACSAWNPVSSSQSHQQPSNTTLSKQNHPNTAVGTSTVTGIASSMDQYNITAAWPGATQADYFAFYNNYLQSLGVSDANTTLPVSIPASNYLPSSGAVQTDAAYASQAFDYAASAAAYYNAFYGAVGYGDPSQSQLYNYMYSYDNSKPT